MIQIRQGCFETNSSSTHAICIPAQCKLGQSLFTFDVDYFGWESASVDACDYLYTAICELYGAEETKRQEILAHIRKVCEKYHCECEFVEPKWRISSWDYTKYLDSEDGYIDHCGELIDLIDNLMKDEDLLIRYLSGAEVFTGNDNNDHERIDDILEEHKNNGYYVYEKGN